MSDNNKDLEDIAKNATEDFYELLGVAFDAEEAAIKKAYRKTSIRYHPDKNPDNKDAADRFIYLGWARDILIDPKLKGEYDRARTRRREKTLQDELLDGRRRQMKQDLERREREGKDFAQNLKRKRAEDMSEAERREHEIQRLAEDGKRRRKEAQERLVKKRQEEDESSFIDLEESRPQALKTRDSAEIDRTVKIRFQREGATQHWDKDKLQDMFAKYGKIDSHRYGVHHLPPTGPRTRSSIRRQSRLSCPRLRELGQWRARDQIAHQRAISPLYTHIHAEQILPGVFRPWRRQRHRRHADWHAQILLQPKDPKHRQSAGSHHDTIKRGRKEEIRRANTETRGCGRDYNMSATLQIFLHFEIPTYL
jgi:curved DNA-binding protein CbpA